MKKAKNLAKGISERQEPGPKSLQLADASLSRSTLVLITLIAIASFGIRLYHLGSQGLECEEFYTIPAATGHHYVFFTTPPEARPAYVPVSSQEYRQLLTPDSEKGLRDVTDVLSRNVHMPLYFYLMHYWVILTGTSEWGMRAPSVIFGTLAVLMVFLLGKELINSFIEILSTILAAFMPDQIYFSQEARMYSLLVFLATSSTYAIVIARKRPGYAWTYILYALTSIAGLYTHYVYVFCFGSQALFIWIISFLNKEKLRPWLITQLSIIAASLPWIFVALDQKQTSTDIIAWIHGNPTGGSILGEIISRITFLISVPEATLGWLNIAAAYILLAIGVMSLCSERATILLLCLWVIVPVIGIVLMDKVLGTHAISVVRYWMVITPSLYILIAAGVRKISRASYQVPLVAVLTACLLISAIWTARGQLRAKIDEHLRLGRFIDEQIQDRNNEFILTEGSNAIPLILSYYTRRNMNILQFGWAMEMHKQQNYVEVMKNGRNVLLLTSGSSQAIKVLESSNYRHTGGPLRFGHVTVHQYTKAEDVPNK